MTVASFLLLGLGHRLDDAVGKDSESVRVARAWIADQLEEFAERSGLLAAEELSPLFASAALARSATSPDPHAALVDVVRRRVRQSVLEDGSIRAGDATLQATTTGLTVLEDSRDPSDAAAVQRIREFLRREAALAVSAPTTSSEPAEVEAARAFLRTTGSSTDPALHDLVDGPSRYAGAPLDRRKAHAHLLEHFDPAGTRLTARFRLPRRGGLVQDLHLAARVLSSHGSPLVKPVESEGILWPGALHRTLFELRDPSTGAWRPTPTDGPSLEATAAALLALDALEPWQDFVELGDTVASLGPARDLAPAILSDDCLDCHQRLQPKLVHQWAESLHASAGIDCATCHGTNHSRMFRDNGAVSPRVCGECHEEATRQFAESKHASAEVALLESSLFQATPQAARASCMECHRIGHVHSDGSRGSCSHCHSSHRASAALAREPEACTGCHRGEDYPQALAYSTSRHGALYYLTRDESLAPTCASCHQPGGHHGTAFGITYGSGGVGGCPAEDTPPIQMKPVGAAEFTARRAEMVQVCAECHSTRFSEQSLRVADDLKREGTRVLGEAAEVLRSLHRDGLLGVPGDPLELGGDQVLVDPALPGSGLLNRFYHMWRYQYAWTWKGSYHSSPSVANLESRPGLDVDLAWIRAAADRLRENAEKEGD